MTEAERVAEMAKHFNEQKNTIVHGEAERIATADLVAAMEAEHKALLHYLSTRGNG